DADQVDILCGHLDDQVTLGDIQLEILLRLTLDHPVLDLDDRRSPVVRIDDGFANLKKHKNVSFRQSPGYHSEYALRFAPMLLPGASRNRSTHPLDWVGT